LIDAANQRDAACLKARGNTHERAHSAYRANTPRARARTQLAGRDGRMTKRRGSNGRKSDPFSFENTASEREAVLFQNGDCPRCNVKSVFIRQCCDKIASLNRTIETKHSELDQAKVALTESRKEMQNACARIYDDLGKLYVYARDTVNKCTLDPSDWSKPLSVPFIEQVSDFSLVDDSRAFLRSKGLEPPAEPPHIEQHGLDAVQFALMQAFAALYQLSLQCESLQLDIAGRAKRDEKAKRASREARLVELQQMVAKTMAQMHESTAAHRAAFEAAAAAVLDECAMQLEQKELECESLRAQPARPSSAPAQPHDTAAFPAHVQRPAGARSSEAGDPSAIVGVSGTALGVASLQQQAVTMASEFRAAIDKLRQELADSRRLLRDAAAANAALLLDRAESERQLVEAHEMLERQVVMPTSHWATPAHTTAHTPKPGTQAASEVGTPLLSRRRRASMSGPLVLTVAASRQSTMAASNDTSGPATQRHIRLHPSLAPSFPSPRSLLSACPPACAPSHFLPRPLPLSLPPLPLSLSPPSPSDTSSLSSLLLLPSHSSIALPLPAFA
jgi:hypothetical protein